MKKISETIKNIKENDLIKSFFIIIFACAFVLIVINQYAIQYFVNGFSAVDKAEVQVFFMDVGQATSTVIVLPNKTMIIIDTGSQESEKSFIESLSLIMSRNKIKEVDYLVLTHSDEDHVGGVMLLLNKFQVNNIFRPKIMSASDIEIENDGDYKIVSTEVYQKVITSVYQEPNCEVEFVKDMVMSVGDGVNMRFFASQKDIYAQVNSYSPFVCLEVYSKTFLFTGDTTAEREGEFLSEIKNSGLSIKVDFLLVAHHGSKYSTTEEFLEEIDPRYAFISAGDSLHPSYEVVTRLQENGSEKIFCTKTDGMIAVGVFKNGTFYICTMDVFVDLPAFVTLFFILIFVLVKLFDRRFQMYDKNKFLRVRRKFF